MTVDTLAGPSVRRREASARPLRIRAMTWEAEDVVSLELVDPSGNRLPPWEPGAHIDLELRPGLVRQYSLCGDPQDDRRWRVAVLREPAGRGGSEHVHTVLRPGDVLPVSGPRNNFQLVDSPEYLFIAGGIGITPLLPMALSVASRGRRWRLVHGGRRRSSMAFLGELAMHEGNVLVRPQDEFGLLDLDDALRSTGPDAVIYCCGPEPLLTAAEQRCAAHGRELHVERFAPKPQPAAAGSSFEVVCKRSGMSTVVGADETVLEALERAGVEVPSSCQNGICGTCETGVLDGEILHRDSLLSESERAAGDTMLVCVSRSRSARLVLDL